MNPYKNYPSKEWIICEKIGKGNYGTVFRVIHKDNQYALKTQLNKSLYKREIKFLRKLHNSGFTPRLHDTWIENNKYCFILDILENDTTMSRREIYNKLSQILNHLHTKKIVFFDLHHGNVLFKGRKVYLIDFALAHSFRNPNTFIKNCYGTFNLQSGQDIDKLFLDYYWGTKKQSKKASKILDSMLI